jgi:hypothetical protein
MTATAVAELCGTWWPAADWCAGRRNHRCTRRPPGHRGRCTCHCGNRRPLPTPKGTS